MLNLQLGWQPAAVLSIGLLAGSLVVGRTSPPEAAPASGSSFPPRDEVFPRRARFRNNWLPRNWDAVRPYLRESAMIAALYALWQLAGSVSALGTQTAFTRAALIAGIERDCGLPSEASLQRLILRHPILEQACNWYYAGLHFAALGAVLLWLFVRHRHRYTRVRNVAALITAASLLIQLIPVAPPRLLPGSGMVDTAALFGQSVYAVGGISIDQLAAMPSVHVGWALLVAWAVLSVSKSAARWWVLAHPIATVFVVVATANHFWLDGIVAAALLAMAIGVATVLPGARSAPRDPARDPPEIELAPGMDDGDAGRAASAHRGQRGGSIVESDPGGDEFVGSHGSGAD